MFLFQPRGTPTQTFEQLCFSLFIIILRSWPSPIQPICPCFVSFVKLQVLCKSPLFRLHTTLRGTRASKVYSKSPYIFNTSVNSVKFLFRSRFFIHVTIFYYNYVFLQVWADSIFPHWLFCILSPAVQHPRLKITCRLEDADYIPTYQYYASEKTYVTRLYVQGWIAESIFLPQTPTHYRTSIENIPDRYHAHRILTIHYTPYTQTFTTFPIHFQSIKDVCLQQQPRHQSIQKDFTVRNKSNSIPNHSCHHHQPFYQHQPHPPSKKWSFPTLQPYVVASLARGMK